MLNEGDERAQGPFADAERQRNSSPVDRLTICVYRDAPNAKRPILRRDDGRMAGLSVKERRTGVGIGQIEDLPRSPLRRRWRTTRG